MDVWLGCPISYLEMDGGLSKLIELLMAAEHNLLKGRIWPPWTRLNDFEKGRPWRRRNVFCCLRKKSPRFECSWVHKSSCISKGTGRSTLVTGCRWRILRFWRGLRLWNMGLSKRMELKGKILTHRHILLIWFQKDLLERCIDACSWNFTCLYGWVYRARCCSRWEQRRVKN